MQTDCGLWRRGGNPLDDPIQRDQAVTIGETRRSTLKREDVDTPPSESSKLDMSFVAKVPEDSNYRIVPHLLHVTSSDEVRSYDRRNEDADTNLDAHCGSTWSHGACAPGCRTSPNKSQPQCIVVDVIGGR